MNFPRMMFTPLLVLTLMACGGGSDPTPPGPTPDFEASLTPATASLTQGQQASVTIKLKRTNGFTGAVSLTLPNPPTGISAAALSIPAGSDGDVLSVSTDASATVGVHSLELSAVSGALSHPVSLELTVTDASTPDFSLAVTPSSVSVKQGLSAPLDVTLNRLNGFTGDVTVMLGNPPPGLTTASLVIPSGSSTGKLNVAAGANAATGSGNMTLQGTSGALNHNVSLPWTILSAVNPDFALSVAGGLSVVQGSSDQVTINLDRQNGFNGIVDVKLVNPPAGIYTAALQIPAGANSGVLGIGVQAQVPVGAVNLKVSGTGGGLTRTVTVPLTVVAAPDTTTPTLVSSSPVNNATGVSIGTSVTFNFSEPMNPNLTFATFSPQGGGTNSIWLNGNTTLKLSLLQSPAPLPGQPSPPSNAYSSDTTYTVDVNGEDLAGNALSGTKSFSFTTQNVQDTTPPTVLDTIPAAGAQGVAPGLGKSFTATFSEKMGSSVLSAVNFVPNAGATNCVFTDSSNTTVQCTPTDGLAANQFYIMTITTAAKDVAGNPLAQLNAISFNTGPTPDTTQPKISSFTPANTSTGIDPYPTITINFSEPMNKVATQAAFAFVSPLLTASDAMNFFWNAAGTTMFVIRTPAFAYDTQVFWTVGPNAKDLSGNPLELASTVVRSFTVIHKGTFKLYSDGSLDGEVNNIQDVDTANIDMSVGFNDFKQSLIFRGFITFDLQKLPKLPLITKIQSASLHVFQEVSNCPDAAYSVLGNVVSENISFAALSPVFFNTFYNISPVSTGTTNILSTDAATGYKIMDTTKQVDFDVKNRAVLFSRSQWRIKFTEDAPLSAQNCYFSSWDSGRAAQAKKPYLDITYLYP